MKTYLEQKTSTQLKLLIMMECDINNIAKFLGHFPLFFSYLGPPIINPHFIIVFTFSISFLPFFVL